MRAGLKNLMMITFAKYLSATLILVAYALIGFSQTITVKFTGRLNGSTYQRLDSVKVTDNSKGWTETVYYPDTIAILSQTDNLVTISSDNDILYQNVPNPFNCTTTAELAISNQSDLKLQLVDVNGRTLASYDGTLNAGIHKFEISAEKPQTYLLNAKVGTKSYSIRMVNIGNCCGNAIKYIEESQDITAKLECLNQFTIGDNMGYIGYATINGNATASNTVIQQQIANQHITLDFSSQSTMPEVTTLPAINVGTTTATLWGWATTQDQAGFLYGTSPDNLQYNVTASSTLTEEFSYQLTGLTPNTTYYYKAYATNTVGTVTGETLNFTTEETSETHDITVRFTAQGHSTNYQYLYLYARLDSVKIQNITNNWTQTLSFPDTVLNVDFPNNSKLTINNNVGANDQMIYTGYTSYHGNVYSQQIHSYLYSRTLEFLFEIPYCDDKYFYIRLADCEPITYNGITYTQNGSYEIERLQTINNCDSVIILDIYIGNQIFNEINIQTCDNSYTLGENTYTESGNYQQIYTSVHGCDSIVSLNLDLGNGFTDERDGNSYCTVTIGNQVWMAENLKYMPAVHSNEDESNTESRYYVYGYSGTNVEEAKSTYNYNEYGPLYNYIAALTACPSGWHLPSDAEWSELEIYLENNGHNFDGYLDNDNDRATHNVIGKAMASQTDWTISDIINAPGWLMRKNNSSGFNGKPAGWKSINHEFKWINECGGWWASDLNTNGNAWDRYLYFNRVNCSKSHNNKHIGMSIRCIQD